MGVRWKGLRKKQIFRIMSLQNAFDLAKKQLDGGNTDTGYVARNGKTYFAYRNNEEWSEYLSEMELKYPFAFKEYHEGDGGELDETHYPPKMASYGSSSRFIYELSRDIPDFHFEKKLGICIPARNDKQEAEASLDGYLESKCIYVEAKCREIYARIHTKFNEKYRVFYDYLSLRTEGRFGFSIQESTSTKGEFVKHVLFSWDNHPLCQLDLKQLLCHLLGIAKKTINDEGKQVPTLIYLVYNPTTELLSWTKSNRTTRLIKECWETEKNEVSTVDFCLLYNCVVHFLYETKGIGNTIPPEIIDRIADAFVFNFCDQNNYMK